MKYYKNGERRCFPRLKLKHQLVASCLVGVNSFRAMPADISRSGMTLLTLPSLPEVDQFTVEIQLAPGIQDRFRVCAMGRTLMKRGKRRFLRLGLKMVDDLESHGRFFKRLGALMVHLDGAPASRDGKNGQKGMPLVANGRGQKWYSFQLPASADFEGNRFSCQTLDVGMAGIRLRTPEGFPRTECFKLNFSEPEGRNLSLMVVERNRRSLNDSGESLVTLGILPGPDTGIYRSFYKRHLPRPQ